MKTRFEQSVLAVFAVKTRLEKKTIIVGLGESYYLSFDFFCKLKQVRKAIPRLSLGD